MTEELIILTQIIFIDLVLAGDNAIIIGMVASKFDPHKRKKIIFWGISAAVILTTSLLMISKMPTYSLKRITIARSLGIFLLLGIGIYLSLVIFYTFKTLFFTGLVYIILIPISYFHYKQKNNFYLKAIKEEETEDIL